MKPNGYLRTIGLVLAGATVLLVLLIPAQTCISFLGQTSCGTVSFIRAISGDLSGVDFRWPLRVGILAIGAVTTLLVLRAAAVRSAS
jgi:hypothetical protein